MNIEITGGTVTAYGGSQSAAIGGAQNLCDTTVSISGGRVYAIGGSPSGTYPFDIGYGMSGTASVSISGSAAVFLGRDRVAGLSGASHMHETYSSLPSSVYGYAIPSAWTEITGAYLRPVTLSYSANGGSGSVPEPQTLLYGATAEVEDLAGLTLSGHVPGSGWNTAAYGSGTDYAPNSMFTFTSDTTLYAKWKPVPTLTSSVTDGKVYTGGRITLAPNVSGGTWTFDSAYLSRDGNTFVGLKAGTTTVTYTVDGVSVSYEITTLPALALTSSASDGKVYTGGRITLAPNVSGGTWTFDSAYLSREGNAFTALKAGTTIVTYTVGDANTSYSVTILAADLPQTGQSYAWAWVLAAASVLILCAAGFAAVRSGFGKHL